jgi:amino acid transporter
LHPDSVSTENDTFAHAGRIAGPWLKYWIEVGAVLSSIGLYSATLSSAAFQLLGMADLGLLPRAFAVRAPVFNTPWLSIVATSAITMGMSFFSFNSIVAAANFLYSLGMLLEFAAFISLRIKRPDMERPYRVPTRLPGAVALCLVPSAFLVFVMAIAGWKVYAISAAFTAVGVGVYYLMRFYKDRGASSSALQATTTTRTAVEMALSNLNIIKCCTFSKFLLCHVISIILNC